MSVYSFVQCDVNLLTFPNLRNSEFDPLCLCQMTQSRSAILTVGSTSFNPLVQAFLTDATLSALVEYGINRRLAQVGQSTLPTGWSEGVNSRTLSSRSSEISVNVEIMRFLDDLEERVGQADLVISHAG